MIGAVTPRISGASADWVHSHQEICLGNIRYSPVWNFLGEQLIFIKKNCSANALNQCEALPVFARLRPIGACAAAFSSSREVIPLRPSKKELFSSFFVNSLKTVFPHPLWFLQYNPRHAPQTHPCPHSRTPQQCRESQWHARPQCQISCPQS